MFEYLQIRIINYDSDGLEDGDEINIHGSDPTIKDTDGVEDGDEVTLYGSDPDDSDTDGDGICDGGEVTLLAAGADPIVINNWYKDSDGDTYGDPASQLVPGVCISYRVRA